MESHIDQILELVLAERRDLESGPRERFDRSSSLQLDKLIAVEELLREYQREALGVSP